MYTILVHEPETKIGPVGTILGGEGGGANSDKCFWIPHNLSFNLMCDSNAGVVA